VGRSFALSGINRPPEVEEAISLTFTKTLFERGIKSPSTVIPSTFAFSLAKRCIENHFK
jgi:hypothetical protein